MVTGSSMVLIQDIGLLDNLHFHQRLQLELMGTGLLTVSIRANHLVELREPMAKMDIHRRLLSETTATSLWMALIPVRSQGQS